MKFSQGMDASMENSSKNDKHVIYLIVLFLLSFLVWAANAPLEEIVKGLGRVVPNTQTQVIQNLEGGIVNEIFVVEGDIVEVGDQIAKMDDTHFNSTYQELQEQKFASTLRLARLIAEQNIKALFVPDKALTAQAPEYALSELELFIARKNDRIATLKTLEALAVLKRREVEILRPIVSRKAVAYIELIRAEQAAVDAEGKISSFQNEFETLRSQEYAETLIKLRQVEEKIRISEDQLLRRDVLSPVHGIVNKILATTIGGVIKPGDALLEIIPLGEILRIEGKIYPKDIGFVYVGMPANIKLTAFDFTIYGTLNGTVVHVGADTVLDLDERQPIPYYKVYVSVDTTQLKGPDGPVDIRPGMQAEIELKAGQKTVLKYLLKPLFKATEAFTER